MKVDQFQFAPLPDESVLVKCTQDDATTAAYFLVARNERNTTLSRDISSRFLNIKSNVNLMTGGKARDLRKSNRSLSLSLSCLWFTIRRKSNGKQRVLFVRRNNKYRLRVKWRRVHILSASIFNWTSLFDNRLSSVRDKRWHDNNWQNICRPSNVYVRARCRGNL